MTKLKSKKITKSTIAVIIMAIAMVAMLAFGGTYAYFTATTQEVTQQTTTGRVQLNANTVAVLTQKVVPGQDLLAGANDKVQVSVNSNVATYVFVKFSATFTKATGAGYNSATPTLITTGDCDAEGEYKLNPVIESGWIAVTGQTGVYYKAVAAQATDGTAEVIDVCNSITFDGYSVSTEELKGSLMDGTLTVKVQSASIQQEGFADAATAFAQVTFPTAG